VATQIKPQNRFTQEQVLHTLASPRTDLSEEMLARQRNLGKVLPQVVVREGVNLDLARAADGYSDTSHGLSLRALHRQRDELEAQNFDALWKTW